jgi:hypothetical protein
VINESVLPDDPPVPPEAMEFDHGCQFFRADDERMRRMTASWVEKGWAAEWKARFGAVANTEGEKHPGAATSDTVAVDDDDDDTQDNADRDRVGSSEGECPDFFGLPSLSLSQQRSRPVFVGVGGMHTLPRAILAEYENRAPQEGCSGRLRVNRGVRVAAMEKDKESGPQLYLVQNL